MKKYLLLIVIPFWFLMSCSDSDEPIPEEIRNEKTLLMYMPWSSNLTSYFLSEYQGYGILYRRVGRIIG